MSRIEPVSYNSSNAVIRGNQSSQVAHNLDTSYGRFTESESGTLSEFWSVLSWRKGTLLMAAVAGAVVAFLLTRMEAPVYRANALLEIQSLNDDFLNRRTVSPTASPANETPDYDIRTQTVILLSRPVVARALGKLDLENRLRTNAQAKTGFSAIKLNSAPLKPPTHDDIIARATARLRNRVEPNTRVIELSYDSTDPHLAADFVNSMVSSFNEVSVENRWKSSESTSTFLSRELADVRSKLEQSERTMQSYADVSDLTFISDKDSAAEEKLRHLQTDLLNAQSDRVAKQSAFEMAASAPPESLPQVVDDSTLKEYQLRLTTLRQQLAELSNTFTPENPKVSNVQAQISSLEADLESKRSTIISRIKNEYVAAGAREKMIDAAFEDQVKLVSKQASKLAHYSILKNEVDTNRQLYDAMIQRVKEASLAAAMQASDVHVIEPAVPPKAPYSPNVLLNTGFGLFTGLCAAALLILRRARMHSGIRGPGDITVQLNIPELGVIPESRYRYSRMRRLIGKPQLAGPLELTTWQQRPSAIAGSFRFALASILLSDKNGAQPQVIVITSANAGEGKTTVISNLAITLAQANRRVLLVDADWRKGRLHRVFDIDNSIGLGQALTGEAAPAMHQTSIPNLFLLPSGEVSDEELFFRSRLPQLIARLRTEFDMILIDTPPVLAMSEARLLSRHADAVILVVAQHTDRNAILLAQRRLAEDGSHLMGTILNNWNPRGTHASKAYGDYFRAYGQDSAL